MFSRVLIANRGEIALRILRACSEMGIETVCVYSQADRNMRYLEWATESVCIGPAPSVDSYLSIPHILSAAEITDVDAIHPGYGFLAESSQFAEICEASNITFIGPSSRVMSLMGNKSEARRVARENKVPIVPGSEGPIQNDDDAVRLAREIGYPVMVKAVSGGGGRGMRVAHNDMSLKNMLSLARSEAQSAFKDPAVYVEKLVTNARHIEVQILGDKHGSVIHLGERDCSVQRRNQKLIEETPSPGISSQTRKEVTQYATKLAKAVGYESAGTIEFLVSSGGDIFFLEMNTRLQVEHPVTEMVTGMDLVKEQIRVATGERLGIQQRHVRNTGVAIECRINAEDPDAGFRANPGPIKELYVPGGPGVRVDTHVEAGYSVPPYYDSLIAKLIVYQPDRTQALQCLERALQEFRIVGIPTTIAFYRKLIRHGHYIDGQFTTTFVDEMLQ
jgi:acetyl-CoA carboxylase biotin carboxylase subunit